MEILLENIFLKYNSRYILQDLSFGVRRGDFVVIVGSSGIGKTTLLRVITRQAIPDSGRVYVLGWDLMRLRPSRVPLLRRQIGVVFQDFRLLRNRTVWENVAIPLEVMGTPGDLIQERVSEAIDLVGVSRLADALPDSLSVGELQRACIARAIVHHPPLLLADEPTGNLDRETTLEIASLLDRINRRGTTVIVATHDVTLIEALKKPVFKMENGRIYDHTAIAQPVNPSL
ncbi:MAG: cell division ATP-binding protein FtsE [bacterium JZ-2024 1]